MDGIKVNAIVLKAVDYKENDKRVALYSLERGKIFAAVRGVKKPAAKLRHAAEPFCFGEFMLAERGGFYTVTGCSAAEMFFEVSGDMDKFYSGSAVLEILNLTGLEGEGSKEFFVEALNALKYISFTEVNPRLAALNFMLKILCSAGYELKLTACTNCTLPFAPPYNTEFLFDPVMGGLLCSACRSAVPPRFPAPPKTDLAPSVLNLLRLLSAFPTSSLETLRPEPSDLSAGLAVINTYYNYVFNRPVKSVEFLV